MAVVVDFAQQFAGRFEFGNAVLLVVPGIDAPFDPMHEAVTTRLAVEQIHAAETLAGLPEVDFDRVVHPAAAQHLHVGAVRFAGEDARRLPFREQTPLGVGEPRLRFGGDRGRVVLAAKLSLAQVADLVPVPAVAPVEPAVGREERPVDIGRVAAEAERLDEHGPFVADAVVVGVFQFPQVRRTARVERAAIPQAPLGEDQLVGKHRRLVEHTVALGVFQDEDLVLRVSQQFRGTAVGAGTLADEQPSPFVEAGQHRVLHERGCGNAFDGEALRHVDRRSLVIRCIGRNEPTAEDERRAGDQGQPVGHGRAPPGILLTHRP